MSVEVEPPDSPPPVLWGDPDAVHDRLGDSVTGLGFETGVVRYPPLSPAHFWASMERDSGSIRLMLEELDRDARAAVDEAAVDALGRHFSDADNAVEMEYRLVTGTVDEAVAVSLGPAARLLRGLASLAGRFSPRSHYPRTPFSRPRAARPR